MESLVNQQSSQEVIAQDLEELVLRLHEEFESLAGKSLLITGGAGFLGNYLTHSILHWNANAAAHRRIRLTVFDNFIRGVPAWLQRLQQGERLLVRQSDVAAPLPKDVGYFDYLIHAASIASPTYYRKHPIETMDANVNGVRNLLEYCRAQKEHDLPVSGMLFFSSSEIYGDPAPENIPTPETYPGLVSCTGPRACYDESKRYGETLCVNFARVHGIPVKSARPFNNYGPGLKITDGRVIPDFARDLFAGRDLTMRSDGSPTRTFCYVADAISGYFKILVKGRFGEAYNIGTDAPEISIAELAKMMSMLATDLFGYKGQVVRRASSERDYLVDNPNRRCPNLSKARSELGYDPSITLREGLRRTLIWYKDNLEAVEA